MGETSTRNYRNGGQKITRAGQSDKDRGSGLKDLPTIAQLILMQAAEEIDQRALLILLVDYYLRPQEICDANLDEGSLVVSNFRTPLVIAEKHREPIEKWFARERRPRTARTIHNILSGRLRQEVIKQLEHLETTQNIPTPWRYDVKCGVRELRRLGEERIALASNGDEAVFRELVHAYDATLAKASYWRLTRLSRSSIENAFAHSVEVIQELMDSRSQAALCLIRSDLSVDV